MSDHRPETVIVDRRSWQSICLVGCWPVGRDTPLADISGCGRNLELSVIGTNPNPVTISFIDDGPVLDGSKNIGGGSGNGGIVVFNDLVINTNWTISYWCSLHGSVDGVLVGGSGAICYLLGSSPSRHVYYQNSGNCYFGIQSIPDNKPTLFTITRSGVNAVLYLNGLQVATGTTAGGADILRRFFGYSSSYVACAKIWDVRVNLLPFTPAMVWKLYDVQSRGDLYLKSLPIGKVPGTIHQLEASLGAQSLADGAMTRAFAIESAAGGLSSVVNSQLSRLYALSSVVDSVANLSNSTSVSVNYALSSAVIGTPQVGGILSLSSSEIARGGQMVKAGRRPTTIKASRRSTTVKALQRKTIITATAR